MKKVFVLMLMLILLSFSVAAVSCGDTVTGDVTLTGDLSCSGDGLVVGASDITIDCNGHSISGDGDSGDYGIDNSAGEDNVTVKDCVIDNFYDNIRQEGANGHFYNNTLKNGRGGVLTYTASATSSVIENNTALNNDYGIVLWSSSGNGHIIRNNYVKDNKYNIYVTSEDNNITDNTLLDSSDVSLFINRDSNIVSKNFINKTNSQDCIQIRSDDNIVENNNLSNAARAGLLFYSGAYDNIIRNNYIYDNLDKGIADYDTNSGFRINVTNNTFIGNTNYDVYIQGDDWTISNNNFTDTANGWSRCEYLFNWNCR